MIYSNTVICFAMIYRDNKFQYCPALGGIIWFMATTIPSHHSVKIVIIPNSPFCLTQLDFGYSYMQQTYFWLSSLASTFQSCLFRYAYSTAFNTLFCDIYGKLNLLLQVIVHTCLDGKLDCNLPYFFLMASTSTCFCLDPLHYVTVLLHS